MQGVGYRYFAVRAATELAVRGWIRNLADGRVEVCAAGTRHQLDDFETRLRMGPPHGDVSRVQVEQAAAAEVQLSGFHIRG